MRIPDEQSLKALGAQGFTNEVELQRFIEDRVAPLYGLRLVSSSMGGRRRLGYIDTTAIDEEGRPVIIEYKWDRIDDHVMNQLARYRQWLVDHAEQFGDEVRASGPGREAHVSQAQLVAIGYRFHPSVHRVKIPVMFMRYGYRPAKTLLLQVVDSADITEELYGEPPLVLSKDSYLEAHLTRTTPAAQEAFGVLRRRLGEAGFVEKIHGKNRVTYRKPDRQTIDIVFTTVAVQCFFDGTEPQDCDGRARHVETGRWDWTCGLASLSDIEAVSRLLGL